MAPKKAMVLAAGLATRMGELSRDLPKCLIPVAGRTPLDFALDRLAQAGVETAVVNLHHQAEKVRAHLGARQGGPEVIFSDETSGLLETGGGVAKALDHFAAEPFYVINAKVLWRDGLTPTLEQLSRAWRDDDMDALLLMASTGEAVGYRGRGDYNLNAAGRLMRREEQAVAPFVYASIHITHPRLFVDCPPGAFSLVRLWDRAQEAGRLHGVRHDGTWYHVGSPDGLRAVEEALTED